MRRPSESSSSPSKPEPNLMSPGGIRAVRLQFEQIGVGQQAVGADPSVIDQCFPPDHRVEREAASRCSAGTVRISAVIPRESSVECVCSKPCCQSISVNALVGSRCDSALVASVTVRTLKIIEDLVGCNHSGISLSEIPILHMRDACFLGNLILPPSGLSLATQPPATCPPWIR